MIKFFRKIRNNLIVENRFNKYLLYAIGEIILVVIGILIALQINNWNEERKASTEEQILLSQLKSDFIDNLEQLDQKIETRTIMLSSCKQLFTFIDNPKLAVKDSIDFLIAATMPYATFDPILHNLSSSGELKFITNKELKQALTNWSSDIIDVIEDESAWKLYRHDHYIPFLQENYQLRSLRNKAFKANLLGNYTIQRNTNDTYTKYDIGYSIHEENFINLLENPEFEDHLTRLYAINSWTNVQSDILRNRIVNIINMLTNEIKND